MDSSPGASGSRGSLHILEAHNDTDIGTKYSDEPETSSSATSATPMTRASWHTRIASRSPRPLLQAIKWVRGSPRKVDLKEPTSWLQLKLGGGRIISLETILIRITRKFTSPYLLAALIAAYIIALAFLARAQWYQTPPESFVDCTGTYWAANNGCGLDGTLCMPSNFSQSFDFRCPAACPNVILANNRAIGATEVAYVPLVVGGGDADHTYRGDSWICVAAVQAGIVSSRKGGCGSLQLVADHTNFPSLSQNGVKSVAFPSTFPISFRFLGSTPLSHCTDIRDSALAFNVLMSSLLFLVLRPKNPLVLFWSLVCIGYWHITFFSDPRGAPPAVSDAFESFLPTLFVAYAYWRSAFRFVLPTFEAIPIERCMWYLGAFWPGVLVNIISEHIPLDRLVGSDLKRPGAITAIVLLLIVIIVIAIIQFFTIRKTGWLPRYLGYYIIGGLVIAVLSQLPGLTFRLHHYIFATLLIPLTAFPTRASVVIQAFMLGMFLDGVSRWGFASILQTAAELRRDAALGTSRPSFLFNDTYSPTSNSTLFWSPIPANLTSEGWNGFSLIVDDVERYSGKGLNYSLSALDWSVRHFFRLAYQQAGTSGDYTRAATIFPNGTFVHPEPGPS